ncbi:MAG: hypothetical protein AB1632_07690 [Nitrospirota bacterium]
MEKNKRTGLRAILSFSITILITVLVLKLLNWIPMSFQKEDIRKYKTIEDVKAKLKISRVYVPAYFPEYIKWPPAEIFAQKRPFVLIMTHFAHADSMKFALSIYQADSRADFEPRKDILYLKNESTVFIKGREGKLVTAVCRGQVRCNSLSWEEGKFRLTLISDDVPEQMIRMAESMR